MAGQSDKQDRLAAMAAAEAAPAPDFTEGDGLPPGFARHLKDWENCPVMPLGIMGKKIVFIDGSKQLCIEGTKCEKNDCVLWFGSEYLHENYSGKSNSDRWDQRELSEHFVMDCRELGPFDPAGAVFGRGAHRAPNGGPELILHLGRDVMIANPNATSRDDAVQIRRAGVLTLQGQRLIYPAASPLPSPAAKPAPRVYVEELLATFQSFTFVYPDIAPLLNVGMLAQMYVGGAYDWRSHMWVTAPTGSGKTTLQNIYRNCLGKWCLHTEDATEAAIRGVLKNDTLPVLIDEAEGHDSPERVQRLINLIKKASAGSKLYRGTVDGGANEFTSQSPFLLSSVLHAPLRGEDRNRMAIVEMRARPAGVYSTPPDFALWRARGPMLHRRMIAHWYRWDDTLEAYKREIARLGFDDRAQQTYGTLLASADLMLFDNPYNQQSFDGEEPGPERVTNTVRLCMPLMERSREEAETDDVRARRLLLSMHLPGAHGNPSEPIGLWLERAIEAFDGMPNKVARDKLIAYGMSVVELRFDAVTGEWKNKRARCDQWEETYVAIASQAHHGLASLLKGSDWRGGNLEQSFARLEGVKYSKVRFAGQTVKAMCIPVKVLMFMEDGSEKAVDWDDDL